MYIYVIGMFYLTKQFEIYFMVLVMYSHKNTKWSKIPYHQSPQYEAQYSHVMKYFHSLFCITLV